MTGIIRVSVDTLCRDKTGQISRDLPTKSLLTWRERLASLRNAPAVAHGFISSCTYVERPRTYLQFSTQEFAHMRFLDFRVIIIILHLLQKTRYLQAGINLCADFSTQRLYPQWKCDQLPSYLFSLVPRCCSRLQSSYRRTLNDAICCQLSICGWGPTARAPLCPSFKSLSLLAGQIADG